MELAAKRSTPREKCLMPSTQILACVPLPIPEEGVSASAWKLFQLRTFILRHTDQLPTQCWEKLTCPRGCPQHIPLISATFAATLCSRSGTETQVAMLFISINLPSSSRCHSLTVGASAVRSLPGLKLSSPFSEHPTCACNLLGDTLLLHREMFPLHEEKICAISPRRDCTIPTQWEGIISPWKGVLYFHRDEVSVIPLQRLWLCSHLLS